MVELSIDLIAQVLRVIAGLTLMFFIPGYAATLAIFPKKSELTLAERVGYSGVLSMFIVVGVVLFMDLVLKIPTTGENISLFLLMFTFAMIVAWKIEVYVINNKNLKNNKKQL